LRYTVNFSRYFMIFIRLSRDFSWNPQRRFQETWLENTGLHYYEVKQHKLQGGAKSSNKYRKLKLQRLHHKRMAIKLLCDKYVAWEIVFVSKYTPDNSIWTGSLAWPTRKDCIIKLPYSTFMTMITVLLWDQVAPISPFSVVYCYRAERQLTLLRLRCSSVRHSPTLIIEICKKSSLELRYM
jgi:hypothetical protein